MSKYSIKDIEHLSGIKAHTIRIWEQRYNFIKPRRTSTNIRYYSDEDLKLILNISLLKDNGYKISHIANMSKDDLKEEVYHLTNRKLGFHDQIQALTIAMIELDEDHFEKLLSKNILQNGFEDTILKIIAPFFVKIGVLWQTGAINPAHEHFISNLVRQKLIVAIDGQVLKTNGRHEKFLLYLPENELHEITLLISSYFIKSRNNSVVYLGQNLPFDDLVEVYNVYNPRYILSVFTSYPKPDAVQDYIYKLSNQFENSTILLSGYQLIGNDFDYPENVIMLNKLEDLLDFLVKP